MIRLSDEVLSWLDAHRGGEPRVVLIRAILREHIRRQARAASRAEARARSRDRGCSQPPQPAAALRPPLAPAALNLVGYLGAVGVDVAARNSWLVHLLGWMVIAFGLRPIAAVPAIIDLRKPFSPAIASAGFPMEIVAIALVRYQAVLQQVSCRRGVCYVYIRTGSVQIDRRPTRPRARSLTLRRLDPELRRSSKDWPGYNLCSLRLLSRSSSHALRLRLSEPSKPLVRPATS